MTTNPLTGQSQLTYQQQIHAEHAATGVAASKALGAAGKLPVNARVNGSWKVGAYVVANVLTLGIVGQIGAYCARSSIMGSAKRNDQKNIWKDMGQTHLNATQDMGTALNFFNKAYTHVVGFVPGHIAGIGFALDLKMADPGSTHVKRFKRELNSTLVDVDKIKHVGVGDLGDLESAGKPIWSKINKEIEDIENSDLGQNYLVTAAIVSGSDELKGAWDNHLRAERSHENGKFCQWTFPIADKMDPGSANYDQDHQLSKYELAVAYHDFVDEAGAEQVNLGGSVRKKLMQAIVDAVGVEYLSDVKGLRDEFKRADKEFETAQIKNPRSQETIRKFIQLNNMKQYLANMRGADDVNLSAEVSRQAFRALKPAHSEIAGLMNDSMGRFINIAYENHIVCQGLDPDTVRKSDEIISNDRFALAQKFEAMGYSAVIAYDISKKIFKPLDDLTVIQKTYPEKSEQATGIVEEKKELVLEVVGKWRENLYMRYDQAKIDLFDKGVPPSKVEGLAEAWFNRDFDIVPATHEEANEILDQIDANYASNFATNTSELDQPPPKNLDFSGRTVNLNFGDGAKDFVANDINADIKEKLDNDNDRDKRFADNTRNEGVYGAFIRDFGRTKFTVNGVVVSDPGDKTRTSKQQMGQCKQKLLDAGVPEDDIRLLTLVLHQGIGATLQLLATNPQAAAVAPSNLHFSRDIGREHEQSGDGVSITIDQKENGKYEFSFELKGPMSSVYDAREPLAQPFLTDPSKSRITRSLSGVFDPTAEDGNWVTVNDADYTYSAVPQATKYRSLSNDPSPIEARNAQGPSIIEEEEEPNR